MISVSNASREKKGSISDVLRNQGRHEKELNLSQKSPSKVNLQKTSSIITFIPILILLFISFAVYFNALFGDFAYDDTLQIVDNPWITDIRNIPPIFFKSVWGFQPRSMDHVIEQYQIVLKLNPNLDEARKNLAIALKLKGSNKADHNG